MRGQRRDVFAALAQRREVNFDRVEAEEEVCAEAAVGDFFVEVGVGRGDDADVDPAGFRGADALHLAGLEHAQELGLLAQGDVGDFVEEEGAAFGEFEAADAVGARVSECAFDVAEELGLEGAFGQGAGVDGDHGSRGAGGERVEGLRDDFFAGAVFAGNEHAGVGGSDAGDGGEDGLHGRRGGDHLGEILRAEEAVFGFGTAWRGERRC